MIRNGCITIVYRYQLYFIKSTKFCKRSCSSCYFRYTPHNHFFQCEFVTIFFKRNIFFSNVNLSQYFFLQHGNIFFILNLFYIFFSIRICHSFFQGMSQVFDITDFSIPRSALLAQNNAIVKKCIILPFVLRQGNTVGVLVAALSPNRPWDHNYQDFFSLLGGQVSAVLGNAKYPSF